GAVSGREHWEPRVSAAESQFLAAIFRALFFPKTGLGGRDRWRRGGVSGRSLRGPAVAAFAFARAIEFDGPNGSGAGGDAATDSKIPALVRRIVSQPEHPAQSDRSVS